MLFAYLDPGSGSALVGTIIAVAGAALYSAKSLFYRLFCANDVALDSEAREPGIAIFSEGKNYWGTFKATVEELIARKIHFAYYTYDLHDPALLIDNEYMHSHLYDKNKAVSFHKLSNLKARVLLTTTPNIGTPGFPVQRSKYVKTMVHVFHAFADISAYHIGSLDDYDVVLTVGSHQEKYIREVEAARKTAAKRMIPVGLPYFDAQFSALKSSVQGNNQFGKQTILVGPSWGTKGLLHEYGTGFILELASAGYDVIVRPHPQSYQTEPDLIARCKRETAGCANIVWDAETIGSVAMQNSDLLISDTSSIRFDYAFLYGKPVITLDIPKTSQREYDGIYQKTHWVDEAAKRIGRVLDHESIDQMVDVVKQTLGGATAANVINFRNETIFNLGKSHSAIVDALQREVQNV